MIKKVILILFLLVCSVQYSNAQSGSWQWARNSTGTTPPGTFCNHSISLAADRMGNSFTTGYFYTPTITFGSTTLTNTSSAATDIFLAKYDISGNFKWAKKAGGSNYDAPNSVAADVSGNVYVTGFYSSPSISFGSTTFTSSGITRTFLVKYDSLGNILWAKSPIGGSQAYCVTTDSGGNVFITGNYTDTLVLGSIILVMIV